MPSGASRFSTASEATAWPSAATTSASMANIAKKSDELGVNGDV